MNYWSGSLDMWEKTQLKEIKKIEYINSNFLKKMVWRILWISIEILQCEADMMRKLNVPWNVNPVCGIELNVHNERMEILTWTQSKQNLCESTVQKEKNFADE